MKRYQSFSSADTKKLGERLARKISHTSSRLTHATIVALAGDLGAGKTTFVQGFFKGLGIRARAVSPTFIIMRRISLKKSKFFREVFHIDAYRLRSAKEARGVGLNQVAKDKKHLMLVEWPERARGLMRKHSFLVRLSHGAKSTERTIEITNRK